MKQWGMGGYVCKLWKDIQILAIIAIKIARKKIASKQTGHIPPLKVTVDPQFPQKELLQELEGASMFTELLVLPG